MAKLAGLVGIVEELRTERTNLVVHLRQVDTALSALGSLNGNSAPTKVVVSAEARRKMSLAQKARWAKSVPTTKTVPTTAQPKKVMSPSARRKIAAAQRARWAKVKAKKAA